MKEVRFTIKLAEEAFNETIPFKVKVENQKRNEKFSFGLTDPKDESVKNYEVDDVLIWELEGENEMVEIVISESLIYSIDDKQSTGFIHYYVNLKPDKKVLELGKGAGIFLDVEKCPEELTKFEIRLDRKD